MYTYCTRSASPCCYCKSQREHFFLIRFYYWLGGAICALAFWLRCKRRPAEDDSEDGAGDRGEDRPGGRVLVPLHNCGGICSSCPQLPTGVSRFILLRPKNRSSIFICIALLPRTPCPGAPLQYMILLSLFFRIRYLFRQYINR